jgi:hypothetical protein
MGRKLLLIFCITNLYFASCNKNTTEPTVNNSVSGTIISNGVPVPQATVSLNKRVDLTTESDSTGHFSILNVPNGDYTLTVQKNNTNGSFQEKTSYITVNNDIILQAFLLPRAVKLELPNNIAGTSMSIYWNPTDANDFREYKLYRHLSSGLDENTGTLIHVSTTIDDTLFEDKSLNPITQYYYRVFVMNEYGRLGGSNIVSAKTSNINYVKNGGFEDKNNFLNWWSLGYQPWDSVTITDSIQKEGNYSLLLTSQPFSEYGVSGERARLFSGFMDLDEGDYKISFWVRVEGIPESVSSYNWYTFMGSDNYVAGIANNNQFPIGVKEGSINENEWTYVEKQIRVLDYYYGRYGFYFEVRSFCKKAWFDDIKVEKVE